MRRDWDCQDAIKQIPHYRIGTYAILDKTDLALIQGLCQPSP